MVATQSDCDFLVVTTGRVSHSDERSLRGLHEEVRRDRFVQWNDPPCRGSLERSLAFVDYVQERARSRPSPNVSLTSPRRRRRQRG
jgi:hypothetical protein